MATKVTTKNATSETFVAAEVCFLGEENPDAEKKRTIYGKYNEALLTLVLQPLCPLRPQVQRVHVVLQRRGPGAQAVHEVPGRGHGGRHHRRRLREVGLLEGEAEQALVVVVAVQGPHAQAGVL